MSIIQIVLQNINKQQNVKNIKILASWRFAALYLEKGIQMY